MTGPERRSLTRKELFDRIQAAMAAEGLESRRFAHVAAREAWTVLKWLLHGDGKEREFIEWPPGEGIVEALAREVHEQVYLPTAKRLGWDVRPEVDVPYEALGEAAKELDRAIARWHLGLPIFTVVSTTSTDANG